MKDGVIHSLYKYLKIILEEIQIGFFMSVARVIMSSQNGMGVGG